MLESLFLGACSIGGAFLHGAIMEDALNNNGKKIADAITKTKVDNQSTTDINTNTNTKVENTKVETVNFADCVYNSIDCFCNIIYDKQIKSYNMDKLVNSYNLLYFIIPKEHKFFPNTYEKLALLRFLYLHNEIELNPSLDINSPNAITDEIDITQYSTIQYSTGDYGLYRRGVDTEGHKEVTKAINLKFQDKLKLWYELQEKDRQRNIDEHYSKFYANYTPLSTRDLFDKIISVLTKHYNYNIKEIQFEPVYSCLLNKVI